MHQWDPYVVFLNETLRMSVKEIPCPSVQKRRSEGNGCAIPALRPEIRC